MRAKSCLSRKAHPDGFTLLELLVVLTIVAVLLVIIPNATAGLATLRLREATADLAETLRMARDVAIQTGCTTQVSIDVQQHSYRMGSGLAQPLSEAVDSISASQHSDTRQSDELEPFRFFADGSATGGTIILRQKLRSTWIKVDWLTGRVLSDD